jgi:hypothetical protein
VIHLRFAPDSLTTPGGLNIRTAGADDGGRPVAIPPGRTPAEGPREPLAWRLEQVTCPACLRAYESAEELEALRRRCIEGHGAVADPELTAWATTGTAAPRVGTGGSATGPSRTSGAA